MCSRDHSTATLASARERIGDVSFRAQGVVRKCGRVDTRLVRICRKSEMSRLESTSRHREQHAGGAARGLAASRRAQLGKKHRSRPLCGSGQRRRWRREKGKRTRQPGPAAPWPPTDAGGGVPEGGKEGRGGRCAGRREGRTRGAVCRKEGRKDAERRRRAKCGAQRPGERKPGSRCEAPAAGQRAGLKPHSPPPLLVRPHSGTLSLSARCPPPPWP
jgi:hypothetical protein